MTTFDFSPLFSRSVGFDHLPALLNAASANASGYPPYDIEALEEDRYAVTLAVAGFVEDDLDIQMKDRQLLVSGKIDKAATERNYLHRGIANRGFSRAFTLGDYVTVTGASLENGLLRIELRRELPDAMKPRKITIQTDKVLENTTDKAA